RKCARNPAYVGDGASIWHRVSLRQVSRSVPQLWLARRSCGNLQPAREGVWTFVAKYPRHDLRCCRLTESLREYPDQVPRMLWPVHTPTNIVPGLRRLSPNRNIQSDRAGPK